MKAVNLTRVIVYLLAAICVIASGFVRNADATPVWVDGFINPDLPPVHPNPDVAYFTEEEEFVSYPAMGTFLSEITHGNFTNISRAILGGSDELEFFDSVATATVDITGMGHFSAVLTGPVSTRVYGKIGNVTGTFVTEILSMTMSGEIGGIDVLIRESPTLSSTGQTSIESSGGYYRIESFFDVFTELSIDGGQTWVPSEESCRITLMPEPATICLLVLGGLGVLGRRRK